MGIRNEPHLPLLEALSPGASATALRVEEDRVEIELEPPALAPLCAGHFPGEPIVPGAHVLGLMTDLAAGLAGVPPDALAPPFVVERSTFARVITPNEPLRVVVRATGGGRFRGRAGPRGARTASVTARLRLR